MVFYKATVFLLVVTPVFCVPWGFRNLERICKETARIENGEDLQFMFEMRFEEESFFRIDKFSCKHGFQMNLKDTEGVTFHCFEGQWDAFYYGLRIKNLTLNDITCERKEATCFPPQIIRNGQFHVRKRYCLPIKSVSSCRNTFYDGDKIVYSCDLGYTAKPYVPQVDPTTTTIADYYSYSYYEEEEGMKKYEPRNLEFECDKNGQWRNGQDDQFPECEKFFCNASRFENISNGYVRNFTSTYEFRENLELVCDEGYTPTSHYGQLTCLSPTSFDEVEDFGCKRVSCPDPVAPIGGSVYLLNQTRYVGDMVMFICDDYKAKLYGPETLICLESGEWSSDHCTLCVPEGADCFPPCMHKNNRLITAEPTFHQGSVLRMMCRYDENKTVTRTCQVNNKWSNSSLNCIAKTDILKSTGITESIDNALMNINANVTSTSDSDSIVGKTIKVGKRGGVDVYFALDVSGSINNKEFENLKKFTFALVKRIKVSDKKDGTRLALFAFASYPRLLLNSHSTGSDKPFGNTEDAVTFLEDRLDLAKLRGEQFGTKIGKGTNIKHVLEDIKIDIETKVAMSEFPAQQVVIIISDGEFNTDGSPNEVADEIKIIQKEDPVQIYSIYLKMDPSDEQSQISGKETMEAMASDIKNENHYFEIDAENFEEVMNQMVEDASGNLLPCGRADPDKIKIKEGAELQVKQKVPSVKHAWPWMVQIKRGEKNLEHICGGTLIDTQHVLSAAHCFVDEGKNVLDGPFTLSFESHLREDSGYNVKVERGAIHVHEKFDKDVDPKYLYDIAVITIPKPIEKYTTILRPICLPKANKVDNWLNSNIFGVITGWGGNAEKLQQAQVKIPDEKTCEESIRKYKIKHNKDVFDSTYMFCAGGTDNNAIVDAEKGDSGGPLIIEDPTNDNSFFQIGIVSFGFEEEDEIPYGVYTKLNKELLEWISKKTNNEN